MTLFLSEISLNEIEVSSEFLANENHKLYLESFFNRLSKINSIIKKISSVEKAFVPISRLDNDLCNELAQVDFIMIHLVKTGEWSNEFNNVYTFLVSELSYVANYFKQSRGLDYSLYLSYTRYLFSYRKENTSFIFQIIGQLQFIMNNKSSEQLIHVMTYSEKDGFSLVVKNTKDFEVAYKTNKLCCSKAALFFEKTTRGHELSNRLFANAAETIIHDFVPNKEMDEYTHRNQQSGVSFSSNLKIMRWEIKTLIENVRSNFLHSS